jgi:hypothetical protein
MIEKVLKSIEVLVDSIYDIDQIGLQEKYLGFIESISEFIEKMAVAGYEVNMNEDLQNITEAMAMKDYTRVADILLYTVKTDFEHLDMDL